LCLLLGCLLANEAAAQGSRLLLAAKQRYEDRDQGTRIVGGDDTNYARNPWQVALVYAEDKDDPARGQFCGGVIIHPMWVLTAAHCVDGGTLPAQMEVVSGTRFLRSGSGYRVAVESVDYHPNYDRLTKNFDIAVVRVKSALKGKAIAPANAAALRNGMKIWVSGWGVTERSEAGATILQGVELDYIASSDCNGPLSYRGAITDNMFCAGKGGAGGGGGIDSCQGDSGGPASIGEDAQSARLVGLVSWGERCAVPYKYGVYTRVSNFFPWVKEKSKGQVRW
jgi:secreted trypsin-like serine protease